jgi:hypothetical protein
MLYRVAPCGANPRRLWPQQADTLGLCAHRPGGARRGEAGARGGRGKEEASGGGIGGREIPIDPRQPLHAIIQTARPRSVIHPTQLQGDFSSGWVYLTAMVRWLSSGSDKMTLLTKKAGGLGLVLVGGLTVAHGATSGRSWETLLGLLLVAIGAALLAAKIVRRNTPTAR